MVVVDFVHKRSGSAQVCVLCSLDATDTWAEPRPNLGQAWASFVVWMWLKSMYTSELLLERHIEMI